MKNKGMPEMHDQHVNVTPLIDVVMCLIIFFMVCGQLAKDESEGTVTLPTAKLGQELTEQRDRLVINVVGAAGALEGTVPELRIRGLIVPYDKLTEYLRTEVRGNKEIKLLVRADEKLHYRFIAPVLISCAEANIKSVHFATRQAG